jgi:hypothetical protein
LNSQPIFHLRLFESPSLESESRPVSVRSGTKKRAALDPYDSYVALQEPDSAFAWLDRSNWLWPHRAALVDPALDPIRSDPRFARLSDRIQREMGLR